MPTPLALYAYQGASSTVFTAAPLTTAVGSPATSFVSSLLGTSLGWSEITGQGTTAAWSAYNGPAYPTGKGFVLDATTLDNQQLASGTWTMNLGLLLGGATWTIVADLLVRVFTLEAGNSGYVYLGSLSLPGQNITTSATVFALSGAIPPERLGVGDRLYVDVWANVTTNSNGQSGLTLGYNLPTSASGSSTLWALASPGFLPQTQLQLSTGYSFGNFDLNDGNNFVVTDKQQDTVQIKQTYLKPARYDGVKKVGEAINERQLSVKMQVVADSRANLENKLGALRQAVAKKGQQLTLQSNDGRYYTADCIDMKVQFKGPVMALVTLVFVAPLPYAYSPFTVSMTDSGAGSFVSGNVYQRSGIILYNAAEAVAYPTVTVTNITPNNGTTLSAALSTGSPITTVAINALPNNANNGSVFRIFDNAGHAQDVTLTVAASSGATSLTVSSFTPNFAYPIGSNCNLDTLVSAITLTNNTDGRSITCSGLALGSTAGNVTFNCNPRGTSGWTAIANNNGIPIGFTGSFPQLEVGTTSWTVQVGMLATPPNNVPTIQTVWTWTPTWLA